MADTAALARLEPIRGGYLSTPAAKRAVAPHYDYLLLMRFAVINLVGFMLVGFAYLFGLIEMVVVADKTGLCLLIAAVFLVGLGLCAGLALAHQPRTEHRPSQKPRCG